MEGFEGKPFGNLIPRYWQPGWNSVQALNQFQTEVAGPLIGGDPGVCLFEPSAETRGESTGQAPEPFQPGEGEWLVVPLHHIFGSEELSSHSPPVAERIPEPYLAISPSDASLLEIDGEPPDRETFYRDPRPGDHRPGDSAQSHALSGEPPPYDANPNEIDLDDWAGFAGERVGPGQVAGGGEGQEAGPGRTRLTRQAEYLQVEFGDETHILPARIDPSLPARVAGLPVGLPGSPALTALLPALARLARVNTGQQGAAS
jgi:hypothetical protein